MSYPVCNVPGVSPCCHDREPSEGQTRPSPRHCVCAQYLTPELPKAEQVRSKRAQRRALDAGMETKENPRAEAKFAQGLSSVFDGLGFQTKEDGK